MKIVNVKARAGETKYGVILRILQCGTFAQAVERFNLQNHPNPWEKLESLAANEAAVTRQLNRISRRLRKLF